MPGPIFQIVTPTFNSEDYLEETIASVIGQAGDFSIRYHVQDGGSTDRTLSILEYWRALLAEGEYPIQCRALTFSFAVEPDSGMYDALNKGVAESQVDDEAVMGWINSDDRLLPGALATAASVFDHFPDVQFIGGRVTLFDQTGCSFGVHVAERFDRELMAMGRYDGRHGPFVMQEGTFWRTGLWRKVGGLDASFRLAGDWDLWRRFAHEAELTTVDTVLGAHRRRPGQLSSEMKAYYAEVDRTLASLTPLEAGAFSAMEPTGSVVVYDMNVRSWRRSSTYGDAQSPPIIIAPRKVVQAVEVVVTSGASAPEGPHPQWNLPARVRWMNAPRLAARAVVPHPGVWTSAIRFRNWHQTLMLRLKIGASTVFEGLVQAGAHQRDIILRAGLELQSGPIELEIEACEPGPTPGLVLLLIDWSLELEQSSPFTLLPPPDPRDSKRPFAQAALIKWPRISVVIPTRNQGEFIGDTLASLVDQGYPELEIIVVDGASTDQTRTIIQRYSEWIDILVSEPDNGQADAINKGMRLASGEILTWLNSDDALAPGALFSVAAAFKRTGADLVAGACVIMNASGAPVSRHMPSILEGALDERELLSLQACWLQGMFFYQPEVFFGRDIWRRAGAHVDAGLYFSIDYELWARMAHAGARVSLVGCDVAYYRMHPGQKTRAPEVYAPELTSCAAKLSKSWSIEPAVPPQELRKRLRIVFFNDYGFKYGAGHAHQRLASALDWAGHEVSALAYADLDSPERHVGRSPKDVLDELVARRPDLVVLGNLHAIAADFDEVLSLLTEAAIPTVFFAHDEWIATGRCAYVGGCDLFKSRCDERCPTWMQYPRLAPARIGPAFDHKRSILHGATAQARPFALFTNSVFMADFLKGALEGSTPAPPVSVVQYGVDTNVYRPRSRAEARRVLGLPPDAFVIAMIAANFADERKGMALALRAINGLDHPEAITLMVIGLAPDELDVRCRVLATGYLWDEDLTAVHYAAADVFLNPTVEEALGQTTLEASACGLPSVGFRIGGVPEVVRHGETGLLAERVDGEALLSALARLRGDGSLRRRLGAAASLYVSSRYSLMACAWSFLTTLGRLPSFEALNLAPDLRFATPQAPGLPISYLSGDPGPLRSSTWHAGPGATLESYAIAGANISAPFAWLEWPLAHLYVRAEQSGACSVRVEGRIPLDEQVLWIRVNGGEPIRLDVGLTAFRRTVLEFEADLLAGWNRLEVRCRDKAEITGHAVPAGCLVENVNVRNLFSQELQPNPGRDGGWQAIEGVGFEEGPFPELGLLDTFYWLSGETIRLRVFSGLAGERTLILKIRNVLAGQALRVVLNGEVAYQRAVRAADFATPQEIEIVTRLKLGWTELSIHPRVLSEADAAGRRLAVILDALWLTQARNTEIVQPQAIEAS